MPTTYLSKDGEFYRDLARRRDAYRNALLAKGIAPGSTKMRALMHRKFR